MDRSIENFAGKMINAGTDNRIPRSKNVAVGEIIRMNSVGLDSIQPQMIDKALSSIAPRQVSIALDSIQPKSLNYGTDNCSLDLIKSRNVFIQTEMSDQHSKLNLISIG